MHASNGKEKLVVEVVAAHNLMPKDGEGSSSPFVEVEFENQRLRTQVKHNDLNPVWNEKLVFHVSDLADLPYRTVDVNVFNERRSNNTRNFLGKVRVSASSAAREGHDSVQLHTLDKRSLFSHVRGELTLKLYLSTKAELKPVTPATGGAAIVSKKNKKMQRKGANLVVPKQIQPGPANDMKPAVVTAFPGAGGGGGVFNDYSLKEKESSGENELRL